MSVISLLFYILVIGFVAYMIQKAPMIHDYLKMLIVGILCLFAIALVLNWFGVHTGFNLLKGN